ncbi:MAG: (d)CMP kinase [Alphaproteobacteria bacterium]|nr:(d)CMP kinase [Alphaproteobacteria bacterium]
MKRVIAIDGPAGSGKGTLARKLASHFGFMYLDTGKLYRAVAYLNKSINETLNLAAREIFDVITNIPDSDLRTAEIGQRASEIAKNTEIRSKMTKIQRDFAELQNGHGFVLDGRDIGTVVFPDAMCKLFITADLKIRAERRLQDLRKNGEKITYDEVLNQLANRDYQDTHREIAPLRCDETYTLIDTTSKTEEESFQECVTEISKKML